MTPGLRRWRQKDQKFKVFLGLRIEFEANLGFVSPVFKKKTKKKNLENKGQDSLLSGNRGLLVLPWEPEFRSQHPHGGGGHKCQ